MDATEAAKAAQAPATAVAHNERRLTKEIAHKERLLAMEFAESAQLSRRNRRIAWYILGAVVLVVVVMVLAGLTR